MKKSEKIQPYDEKNMLILNALFEEGMLVPSLQKISKKTKLSKQTVYQRLNWLKKNGIIINYVPAINPFDMGVKMLNFELVKVNLADDNIQKKFKEIMNDKHIVMASALAPTSEYTLGIIRAYSGIEDYQLDNYRLNKEYPELMNYVKSSVSGLSFITEKTYIKHFSYKNFLEIIEKVKK